MLKNPKLLPSSPIANWLAQYSRKTQRRLQLDGLLRAHAQQVVQHKGNLSSNTNRNPSPAIWADCPFQAIREGSTPGLAFFDDFQEFPLAGTQTTQIGFSKYKLFHTTAGQFTRVSTINSVEIDILPFR